MLENYKKELSEKGEIYLKIKVKPGAGLNVIKSVMTDRTIKVDIAASPVKGKVNQQLINLLSAVFNCRRNDIKIITGAGTKTKLVKINR